MVAAPPGNPESAGHTVERSMRPLLELANHEHRTSGGQAAGRFGWSGRPVVE